MPAFFLNYGGPGSRWMAEDREIIQQLDEACQKSYFWPIRKVTYEIKGITATVCTYGLHRALLLEIPDNAPEQTVHMYEQAKKAGKIVRCKDYKQLRNNCVTAVAAALNCLDSNMVPPDVVLPWSLDAQLDLYCGYYQENTTTNFFITKYQEKVRGEFFSFFRTRHWTKNKISTSEDIIAHAYGQTGGTGERTKSTLLELGWVVEDNNRILRPADDAPNDFKMALEAYNQDFEKQEDAKNGLQFQ